jgi:hypothetical protein
VPGAEHAIDTAMLAVAGSPSQRPNSRFPEIFANTR